MRAGQIVGARAQSSPQIATSRNAKDDADRVVGDPAEGALPGDRLGGRDALVAEATAREVADPAPQQGVVEGRDVEPASKDEAPRHP